MSLNVRNQECSRWRDFQFNLVSGKDVGHGATKLIGQNYTKKIQTHSCCCHWTVTSHSALTIYCLSVTALHRVGGFIHVRNVLELILFWLLKQRLLLCLWYAAKSVLHFACTLFSAVRRLMESSETGQLWDVDKLFESTCCVSLEMYIPALHK